jgi:hypothetical protein
MSDDRFTINLHEFVKEETRRAKQILTTHDMLAAPGTIDIQRLAHRVRSYEERSSILRSVFAAGTYWSRPDTIKLWGECFAGIAFSEHNGGGGAAWLKLRSYPALLLKYAVGISAVLSNNYTAFSDICNRRMLGRYAGGEEVGLGLHGSEIIDHARANEMQNLTSGTQTKFHTPLSEYLFDVLRPDFDDMIISEEEYKRAFDKFEYLAGLVHLDLRIKNNPEIWIWLPIGAYRWRSWGRYDYHVAEEVGQEVARNGTNWPPLQASLFGGDLARLESVIKKANDWLTSDNFASWSF